MLPRDTDPFSPTRKKSDPFEEGGDFFSKMDPFDFEFNSMQTVIDEKPKRYKKSTIKGSPTSGAYTKSSGTMQHNTTDSYNSHLQVNLPPENSMNEFVGTSNSTITTTTTTTASISGTLGSGAGSILANMRSRPIANAVSVIPAAVLPGSVAFKQQTVDVLSSISNKKMPHLFGQSSRFSKNESNTINMRRLQESDSLSENEATNTTGSPSRTDMSAYMEPPPLPPKKQFNDIISHTPLNYGSSAVSGSRYEYIDPMEVSRSSVLSRAGVTSTGDIPPIPLPSRKISRSDGNYPGPGRPRKPGFTDDDYLAPLTGTGVNSSVTTTSTTTTSIPPLLPPPMQTSSRNRSQRTHALHTQRSADIYENKYEILQQQIEQQQQHQQQKQASTTDNTLVPDITLSQLLTLGIDEMAAKLNVPTSKLSTMTLVELTSYLADYITTSKKSSASIERPASGETCPGGALMMGMPTMKTPSPIVKIDLDQDVTFIAKFDDDDSNEDDGVTGNASADAQVINKENDNNFNYPGNQCAAFETNFAQFEKINATLEQSIESVQNYPPPAVPPADRYAVFREIIDQELDEKYRDRNASQPTIEKSTLNTLSTSTVAANITNNANISATTTITGPGSTDDYDTKNNVDDNNENVKFHSNFTQHFKNNMRGDEFRFGNQENDDNRLNALGMQTTERKQPQRIDTKITEVVAQAKDRYAALRDIILVENLFEKNTTPLTNVVRNENTMKVDEHKTLVQNNNNYNGCQDDDEDFNNDDQDLRQLMDGKGTPNVGVQEQRLSVIDNHGILVEPSSSALTVEDEDDEEDEEDDEEVGCESQSEYHKAADDEEEEEEEEAGNSSADSNVKLNAKTVLTANKYEQLVSSNQHLDQKLDSSKGEKVTEEAPKIRITESELQTNNAGLSYNYNEKLLSTTDNSGVSTGLRCYKDDHEIDTLMQKAISNLSLDSRERNSPLNSSNQTPVPTFLAFTGLTATSTATTSAIQHFSDVSTSPIPPQSSPVQSAMLSQGNNSLTVMNNDLLSQSIIPTTITTTTATEISSISNQLEGVSQFIEAATKQMQMEQVARSSNESWATFDNNDEIMPQKVNSEIRTRPQTKQNLITTSSILHIPPPPPSTSFSLPSTMQANSGNLGSSIANSLHSENVPESPCSSDPRDDMYQKRSFDGSNLSIGQQHAMGTLGPTKRWQKRERQHTSSSSRDLSWDEEHNMYRDGMDYGPRKWHLPAHVSDRYNYYMRHSRRMNSCDEDYE